jgi:hypothetical protein
MTAGAVMVNALVLHRAVCKKQMPVTNFKEAVIMKLLHVGESSESNVVTDTVSSIVSCALVKTRSARRCTACCEVMKN